jgi:hypothetical protein
MATLSKVTAKTAAEVCKRFALTEPGAKLLKDSLAPGQFLDVLLKDQHFIDAVKLLAYALPKPEAVWWACQCVRAVGGSKLPPNAAAAIEAAEQWVANPSEDNRRAAMTAAESAQLGTSAGCAAVAAFWSGGSMGPPNVPAIPPGEHLTAHGVAGSVMLAAVESEPAKAPEKYRKFFELGVAIANGTNRWKESPPKK